MNDIKSKGVGSAKMCTRLKRINAVYVGVYVCVCVMWVLCWVKSKVNRQVCVCRERQT